MRGATRTEPLDADRRSLRMLSPAEARRAYDRLAVTMDWQGWLEDRVTSEVVRHAPLDSTRRLFEFGCGTARFAAELLARRLPATARYRGIDISPVMVARARNRLAPFGDRASIQLTDGQPPAGEPGGAYDAFVSNFVLDLLPDAQIAAVLGEAHRLLTAGGWIGLCSLAHGCTRPSRAFMTMWLGVRRVQPALVGGSRPIDLRAFVAPSAWQVEHYAHVTRAAVPLQALVARRR